MARRKQTSEEVNEYVNLDTGEVVGAYAGTEQDKVYREDPDYDLVGRRASVTVPGPRESSAAAGEEGDALGAADLDGMGRDELNELAAAKGVKDPADLANKDEVKAAILAAAGEEGE